MARESKSIQVYPDDRKVNQTIEVYEAFGWEVIGNQRCQEFTGQDSDGTKNYSTFVKLTFSRDKAEPWYKQVAALENEFYSLVDRLQSLEGSEPKGFNFLVCLILLCLWVLPGIIYIIVKVRGKAAYKKALADNLDEREKIEQRMDDIVNESRALIDGE